MRVLGPFGLGVGGFGSCIEEGGCVILPHRPIETRLDRC